jgi:hypothetical protein
LPFRILEGLRGALALGLVAADASPSLAGLGYDEARDHLALRDPCRRHGASLERGADVHFDGVVPDEQVSLTTSKFHSQRSAMAGSTGPSFVRAKAAERHLVPGREAEQEL